MKWYSVKEFTPSVLNSDLLVRNKFGIWVAKLESEGDWIDQDKRYLEDDAFPTHFCIPDPIFIKDE